MHIEILTIFPEYFRSPLSESLLGKGIASGLLEVVVTDLRQFATDRHHKVDDEPYGGGPGRVMMAHRVAAARGGPRAGSRRRAAFRRSGLDHSHFPRPRCFRGLSAPEALLSGDHARIERWRRARALKATRPRRPALLFQRPEEPGERDE